MPDTFRACRASPRGLAYLIGSVMLVAGITASGTAQAVMRAPRAATPQAAARAPHAAENTRPSPTCVDRTGTTSSKAPTGGSVANGSEFTVQCPFPTLIKADRHDAYRGYLLLPPGRWTPCTAWITYPPSSPTNNVLCGDVTVGTQMTVVAKMGGSVRIKVGV